MKFGLVREKTLEMILIIAQAIIIKDKYILMVRQFVQRGAIVWNFPGGGIEEGETPDEACIREVKEETGLDVKALKLIQHQEGKYTYLVTDIEGRIHLDKSNKDNDDIIEIKWLSIDDYKIFDNYTKPIIELVRKLEDSPNIT
ncbi:NUDIX hydrolase [Paenibacillus sp. FSL R5-0810]|uniref:NUDIX hydrolase n=1 Tax=Paenibacillus sp. FSL R5-0810 TaxID=2921659 RepID=UPI0030F95FE7